MEQKRRLGEERLRMEESGEFYGRPVLKGKTTVPIVSVIRGQILIIV